MTVVYGGGAHPAYLIDDDTLREDPLSPSEVRAWCQEHPDDPMAASYWRMIGELDRASDAGERSLDEQEFGSLGWAAAGLRLAAVRHWQGRYDEADDLFGEAEEVFRGAGRDDLVAVVLQHRAKCLLDQGLVDAARAQAEAALQLRLAMTPVVPEQVASTEQVLAAIAGREV